MQLLPHFPGLMDRVNPSQACRGTAGTQGKFIHSKKEPISNLQMLILLLKSRSLLPSIACDTRPAGIQMLSARSRKAKKLENASIALRMMDKNNSLQVSLTPSVYSLHFVLNYPVTLLN